MSTLQPNTDLRALDRLVGTWAVTYPGGGYPSAMTRVGVAP